MLWGNLLLKWGGPVCVDKTANIHFKSYRKSLSNLWKASWSGVLLYQSKYPFKNNILTHNNKYTPATFTPRKDFLIAWPEDTHFHPTNQMWNLFFTPKKTHKLKIFFSVSVKLHLETRKLPAIFGSIMEQITGLKNKDPCQIKCYLSADPQTMHSKTWKQSERGTLKRKR